MVPVPGGNGGDDATVIDGDDIGIIGVGGFIGVIPCATIGPIVEDPEPITTFPGGTY